MHACKWRAGPWLDNDRSSKRIRQKQTQVGRQVGRQSAPGGQEAASHLPVAAAGPHRHQRVDKQAEGQHSQQQAAVCQEGSHKQEVCDVTLPVHPPQAALEPLPQPPARGSTRGRAAGSSSACATGLH